MWTLLCTAVCAWAGSLTARSKLGSGALGLVRKGLTRLEDLGIYRNGPELLKSILQNNFRGLSGNFDLQYKQLEVSTFRIINVVGKGGREIGFWTSRNGLSRKLNETRLTNPGSSLVPDLNPVIWPGESIEVPRGFQIPVMGKKLQVGVRTSGYPEFIKVEIDNITGTTKASGLSVDVFEEAVKRLPYALPYEYVIFGSTEEMSSGSSDEFIYEVYVKVRKSFELTLKVRPMLTLGYVICGPITIDLG